MGTVSEEIGLYDIVVQFAAADGSQLSPPVRIRDRPDEYYCSSCRCFIPGSRVGINSKTLVVKHMDHLNCGGNRSYILVVPWHGSFCSN